MAKESFDKEIQFLRMLSLTSGAYNRKQYAERLGISVHTFDKTTRRLKEIMQSVADQRQGSEPSKEMTDLVRFQYGESAEPCCFSFSGQIDERNRGSAAFRHFTYTSGQRADCNGTAGCLLCRSARGTCIA